MKKNRINKFEKKKKVDQVSMSTNFQLGEFGVPLVCQSQ